jgi:hypothetical protein
MFFFVDKQDLQGFRRFFDLIHETRMPLSFIIISCDGYYDILSMQPDWYIRHNNQFKSSALKAKPRDPSVRTDIHDILNSTDWKQDMPDPVELHASPFGRIAEAYEQLSQAFQCSQKVEDEFIYWYGDAGQLEAMFCVCKDTDLQRIRLIYQEINDRNCPITWLFLRLTHWTNPVFDVLSLSKNHYMAHRNRIGDWEHSIYDDV